MSENIDQIKAALLGSARAAILHETVAIMVLDPKCHLLLFLRKKPPLGWTIPAGHWERDESAIDAAVRELREETGLHVRNERMRSIGEIMPSADQPIPCRRCSLTTHRYHVFLTCLDWQECDRILLGEEADEKNGALWMPTEENQLCQMSEPEEKLTPGTRFVLKHPQIQTYLQTLHAADA